jgi:hypothetical protein
VYWFFPYPNQRYLWMNFKSPLMWDVFAISTYFTVSAVFFYVGLVPDIADLPRPQQGPRPQGVRRLLAVGWRGTDRQWHHYMGAYGFFAALAAPLVLSVHSVVSWDFAMAPPPGGTPPSSRRTSWPAPSSRAARWSSRLLMPMTYAVRLAQVRQHLALREPGQDVPAHERHPDLRVRRWSTSSAGTRQNPYEWAIFYWRADRPTTPGRSGPDGVLQLRRPAGLVLEAGRTNHVVLFVVSIFINIGMWFERFNIVVSSLAHNFDPATWTTTGPPGSSGASSSARSAGSSSGSSSSSRPSRPSPSPRSRRWWRRRSVGTLEAK